MPLGTEVGLSPGDFVLDGDPAPSPKKEQRPPFLAHRYCRQSAAWTKLLGLSANDIVLHGDRAPSPKTIRAQPPIYRPCLLWPNGCMYQDTTWYRATPQPRLHCVRLEPSSPPLKGHSPQFSANVRCGQTAGWTKMPLGMEIGLSPGDFVFDGDPATPRKKGTPTPPNFWLMSIVAKRLDG